MLVPPHSHIREKSTVKGYWTNIPLACWENTVQQPKLYVVAGLVVADTVYTPPTIDGGLGTGYGV